MKKISMVIAVLLLSLTILKSNAQTGAISVYPSTIVDSKNAVLNKRVDSLVIAFTSLQRSFTALQITVTNLSVPINYQPQIEALKSSIRFTVTRDGLYVIKSQTTNVDTLGINLAR